MIKSGDLALIDSPFLYKNLYSPLRAASGFYTNLKFKVRGTFEPQAKILIIAIDENSLNNIGRWPWKRDVIASLIQNSVDYGAKVIGLDFVLAEEEVLVPPELKQFLKERDLDHALEPFETDRKLGHIIFKNRKKVVLGWTRHFGCRPNQSSMKDCPVTSAEYMQDKPPGISKFKLPAIIDPAFDFQRTPIRSLVNSVPNHISFNLVAKHAGLFSAWEDPDGFIRRTNPFVLYDGELYPTLPTAMVKAGEGKEIEIILDKNSELSSFKMDGREVPLGPGGDLEINFGGPSFSFSYVSALQVLRSNEEMIDVEGKISSSEKKTEVFKDAYVFIGATAAGLKDIRAFPFDANTPGVEGHAWILENMLTGNFLRSESPLAAFVIFLIMIFFGFIHLFMLSRFGSVTSIIATLLVVVGIFLIDQLMFGIQNLNYNLSFFYAEIASLSVVSISARFILEEQHKKYLKNAFGHYISPEVVEAISKEEGELTLHGDRKNLTIFFSDIRGFTSISECLDPQTLSLFLNEYMTLMLNIAVEKHHGTLDKYIGDAIMAFWGAPYPQKDQALRACQAAIDMQVALKQSDERFKKKYGNIIRMGVGLNTGEAVVGNMGWEKQFNYTAIGDAVNLASRLEGLTKIYGAEILMTQSTYEEVQPEKNNIISRPLDLVKVKGKTKAAELHQVFSEPVSPEGLKLFAEARDLFLNRKWNDAYETFRKAAVVFEKNGYTDKASITFAERALSLEKDPPAEDWDGSLEMHTK